MFISHNVWIVPAQLICFLLPSIFVIFQFGQTNLFKTHVAQRMWLKIILASLLATAVLNGVEQIWHCWFPLPEAYTRELQAMMHLGQPHGLLVDLAVMALLPAVAEEFFFRGFLQSVLLKSARPRTAILISSLIFGAYHLNPVLLPFYFVLGIFFGWLVHKTQNIWTAVLAHLIVNGLGVGMVYWVGHI